MGALVDQKVYWGVCNPKKKLKITQNKKLVRKSNGTRFEIFRTFSKKNIDFLTSKIEFLSKVPTLKAIQNTILYIFINIYHFCIPIFQKMDFQSF